VVQAREGYASLFQLTRLVRLGRFLQRIEAIYVVLWGIAIAATLSFTLYLMAAVTARITMSPEYRPFIYPYAIIIMVTAALPHDLPATIETVRLSLRAFSWIPAFALPGAVWLVAVLRGMESVPPTERAGGEADHEAFNQK